MRTMTPYYETPGGRVKLYLGDAIEVMASFPDACVDAIVTDPPYGLEFMGKQWDRFKGDNLIMPPQGAYEHKKGFDRMVRHLSSREGLLAYQSWTIAWATEAYRILKPGAYMVVMGGTRTHHRLGCGLEDAGFEIRDELAWIYASGFPKNYDVSKGIDKRAGAEREVVGIKPGHEEFADRETDGHILAFKGTLGGPGGFDRPWMEDDAKRERYHHKTAPATPEAEYWEGYGTALKPAHEPIWLCKKPNEGTYVDNVLKHGCGAMNIDGSRIDYQGQPHLVHGATPGSFEPGSGEAFKDYREVHGRWPANVIVDCYPEEFQGGVVVPEREIRLHGPPKDGLRGPEISWERTKEWDGNRELWIFTETYFDDGDIDEEGCTAYPYPQFVWLRKTIGGVVIEGEAQLHHGGLIRASKSIGDGNIYQGGGPGLRREPNESSRGNGLLGPYTRFFVIPKPSRAERNRGCMELYWRKEKAGGHVLISQEEWEPLIIEEKRIYEETGKRVRLQARGNIHVTVKPVRLMKWLIKLIVPHQHPVVLADPFCGSGTSLVAGSELNREEGYQIEMYGVDKELNNMVIAKARLEAERRYLL